MPEYTQPQLLENGQILGRSHLGIFIDNDYYFSGVADRWREPGTGIYDLITYAQDQVVWDGYIIISAASHVLDYSFSSSGGDLRMYLDSVSEANKVATSGGPLSWVTPGFGGTDSRIDMLNAVAPDGSGRTPGTNATGLRRIIFVSDSDAGDIGMTCTVKPPYVTYDTEAAGYYYRGSPDINDGDVSTENSFQRWAHNDRFFNQIRPPQPAIQAVRSEWVIGSADDQHIWDGWFRYDTNLDTVYYRLSLADVEPSGSVGDNEIGIYVVDDNSTHNEIATVTGVTDTESSATLTGTYTRWQWYRIYTRMQRSSDSEPNALGTSRYVYVGPSSVATSPVPFTNMDVPDVNSWVRGDWSPTGTEHLRLLSNNDRNIMERMAPRIDPAVKTAPGVATVYPTMPGVNYLSWYRLKRRYNWLYYRGTNLELSWGDYSVNLDDVTSGYGTVDLVALKGLHYGMIYAVETHGGALEFAFETFEGV